MFRYVGGRRDWFAAGLGMAGRRARRVRAGDVARRDVPTCRLDDRLDEVRTRVRASDWDVCIVVNEAGVVLGRLGGTAWAAPARTSVEAVMTTPTTYRPDALIDALREVMYGRRARDVLITDSDGKLVGLVDGGELERRRAGSRSGSPQPRGGRRSARARRAGR